MLELVKNPEIEDATKSNSLNQINSRIQSVLISNDQPRTQSKYGSSSLGDNHFSANNTHYANTYNAGFNSHYTSNNNSVTNSQSDNHSQNVWEQFEAMKQQDCGGVSEEAFLRDLIYVLQGLEGNFLLFNESSGAYVVNGRISVSRPIRSLVEKLGRIGTDYRYLQGQVGVHRESGGVLRQSFCRAMAHELSEYLKLVAYLESSLSEREGSEASMSLKKVVYWFHEAGILLNFLRELVKDTVELRGGALLSFLEGFRMHGNDQIRAVITRILDQLMIPYGEMLQGWLREGRLNDPFHEFFICEAGGTRGFEFDWKQKFVLRASELPKFIPEPLARRALVAGKTRKFIQAFRKNPPMHLRYQTLVESPSMSSMVGSGSNDDLNGVVRENLLESFEREMKLAYRQACKQVRRILLAECRLVDQVRCIKQYVLLSKGDFSMNLLELLWDGLNRPAGSLFRHNLVGVLESCIESTRSVHEPDWMLANLDVRLLSNDQISGGSGACGWDVFALDYRVNFPSDCVIDPQSMQEYSKLSRYIWGLKRLEAVLSRCWQSLRGAQVSASRTVRRELRVDLRKMELLQYEMISFVRQALSVSFEAINGEWNVFEDTMKRIVEVDSQGSENEEKDQERDQDEADLDALIQTHANFLSGLQAKLRLWATPAMRSKMQVVSLGILRFESVQAALVAVIEGQSGAPSLQEMRSLFLSTARHFQTDLDDLFATLQKESSLNSASSASSPTGADLVCRLDFNEYHRRRNGFDTKKYM